jgi:hypothetical protein
MPNDPMPPPGYTLMDLPSFLRPSNVGTKIVTAPPMQAGQGQIVADVDPENPTTIQVRYPAGYTKAVNTHESTHVYQQSRNPAFASLQGQQQATTAKAYDYGGVDGLLQAQQQGKTISDFTPEQQATMVSDYQQETQKAIAMGGTAGRVALARTTAAFHPFITQLAAIPAKGANMSQMTPHDLTPPAPSVPPATVAGMPMQADKLLQ